MPGQGSPFCRQGKDQVFLRNTAQDVQFLRVVADIKVGHNLPTDLLGTLVDGSSVVRACSIFFRGKEPKVDLQYSWWCSQGLICIHLRFLNLDPC